ncbi:hypothetical protein [Bacillus sp. MUM 13]|uniref:hypothetical protein n=1 Tax=Bacillus sp. MUM 13 TaxID=1678001 RepID=UPI0026D060AB
MEIMAITLPHIEDSSLTGYVPPKEEYIIFTDESHYEEKVREWGLSSTKEVKREFWYKDKTYQRLVTIKGYEEFGVTGQFNSLVVEFQDGNLTCIFPDFLKDMQSPNFGKETKGSPDEETVKPVRAKAAPAKTPSKEKTVNPASPSSKKEKTPKLELPEEKVHFTARVKQFALSYNHFKEENEEVVILEHVIIQQDEPIEAGIAWCSYSKTLKKFELSPGESLSFDGKIVAKTLPKGKDAEEEFILDVPAKYKINNPSKIVKD